MFFVTKKVFQYCYELYLYLKYHFYRLHENHKKNRLKFLSLRLIHIK